ncbi:hypothetical protein D9M68_782760 [compost metagenome]
MLARRSWLLATPLLKARVPLSSRNGVSLPPRLPLSTLRLRVAMPWQSCCSRLASSSAPSFRAKLAVPFRPSIQAF